ncbi:MAG: hypothetical protein IT291_05820 [Deltaproteobacteria bacterium]|nr:hypothetical protein [Deltaproteobacteria bacterium]
MANGELFTKEKIVYCLKKLRERRKETKKYFLILQNVTKPLTQAVLLMSCTRRGLISAVNELQESLAEGVSVVYTGRINTSDHPSIDCIYRWELVDIARGKYAFAARRQEVPTYSAEDLRVIVRRVIAR